MRVLLESGRSGQEGESRQAGEQGRFDTGAVQGKLLIVPPGPADVAAHYDLTISHPAVNMESFAAFDRWLAKAAARRGLSCALLHDGVVHEAIARLQQRRLAIHYHLDYYALWHVANNPYARLSEAVRDAGGRPVNPPGRSRIFTDKANAHAALQRQGLGVPETVLIR